MVALAGNGYGLGAVVCQPVRWGKLRQTRVMLSFFSLFFCAVGVFFLY